MAINKLVGASPIAIAPAVQGRPLPNRARSPRHAPRPAVCERPLSRSSRCASPSPPLSLDSCHGRSRTTARGPWPPWPGTNFTSARHTKKRCGHEDPRGIFHTLPRLQERGGEPRSPVRPLASPAAGPTHACARPAGTGWTLRWDGRGGADVRRRRGGVPGPRSPAGCWDG